MNPESNQNETIRSLIELALDYTPDTDEPALMVFSELGKQAGERIGRYELVELIGEGGFGVVWLARQLEPIQREVALKLLKPGMDSREVVARFAAERQVLARMEHANIAAVLDAGATEGGHLYFVMERIAGPPITQYCDEHRMPLSERVRLFLDVCGAVQHAHRKALIHRDLKPSNILVSESEGQAVPKVIDFGIAKALSAEPFDENSGTFAHTGSDRIFGTPEYMSPEQAEGRADIDTRSDVYSLGVVLYELLTGETPLAAAVGRGDSRETVLRKVREQETRRPSGCFRDTSNDRGETEPRRGCSFSRLERLLRDELDWILLRALEKDRKRRYQSVEEFAADLQRHLRNEPVLAGPPSPWYRARKFARRNCAILTGAGAAVAMLLIGLGIAASQAIRATRAERISNSRLEMAEQARDAAESLLSDSVVTMRERLMPLGKTGLFGDSLEAVEAYFEQLPEELATRTTIERSIQLRFNLGLVALIEGRLDVAKENLESALAEVESLEATSTLDETMQHEAVFTALMAANAHIESGDFEASRRFREIARRRSNAWLATRPDSLWALACLSHDAALATLEANLLFRQPAQAIPLIARLKYYESRLARLDDQSPEYYQARALSLFCEAFAAKYLGASPERVIELFELAAATFKLGFESDKNPIYRFVYLELQLASETAAGTRLIDLGLEKHDPLLFERGRNLILDAYTKRLELAQWDPRRIDWWKDLAGSCKQIVKIAVNTKDEEEAARLLGIVFEMAPVIAVHVKNHPAAAQTLSQALEDGLHLHRSLGSEWEANQVNLLALAIDLWTHAADSRPDAYNGDKDLISLIYLVDNFRKEPGALQHLHRELDLVGRELERLSTKTPENSALEAGRILLSMRLARIENQIAPSEVSEDQFGPCLEEMIEAANRYKPGQSSTLFLSSMLQGSYDGTRSWLGGQDKAVRVPLAESLRDRIAPVLSNLETIASQNPNRPSDQLASWAAWRLRSVFDEVIDANDMDEPHRRLMHWFRAAERASLDIPDKSRLSSFIVLSHCTSLDRWALHLDRAGRDGDALEAVTEATRVLSLRLAPRTSGDLEFSIRLKVGELFLLTDLGRTEEAKQSAKALRTLIETFAARNSSSPLIPSYRFVGSVMEFALSPNGEATGSGEFNFDQLDSRMATLLPQVTSVYRLAHIDRAWSHLWDARRGTLSRQESESIRRAWGKTRMAIMSEKPSKFLEASLAPLPE